MLLANSPCVIRYPLGTLFERPVTQILVIEPAPVSASVTATRAWRTRVWSHAAALTEATCSRDDEDRVQIAARPAGLPGRDRVWGCPPGDGS